MRYGIIGDIHGELATLAALILTHAEVFAGCDRLIFVGDYVDRGPNSLGVLRFLDGLRRSRDVVLLRGNHERKHLRRRATASDTLPPGVGPDEAEEFYGYLTAFNQIYYKDRNILVTHAPCALYQHELAKEADMMYGHSLTGHAGAYGPVSSRYAAVEPDYSHTPLGRSRASLAQVYPGEISTHPVIFGHVHAGGVPGIHRKNEYCVDYDCGSGGALALLELEVDAGRVIREAVYLQPEVREVVCSE